MNAATKLADIAFAYATQPGDGHRVRSYALAHELQSRGCQTRLPGARRHAGTADAIVLDFHDWTVERQRGTRMTIAITDEPDQPAGFAADLVINPNVTGLGGDFCILRPDFDKAPRRRVRKRVHRTLVCFGGPGPIRDMRAAMLSADVGIVTAGTLLHEACAMGLPTVSVSLNEPQHREARAIALAGATLYAGPLDQYAPGELEQKRVLLEDHELRQRMSDAGMALIDRQGRKRVADLILNHIGAG